MLIRETSVLVAVDFQAIDFNTLLDANRYIPNIRVRIDFQVVLFGELANFS